MWLKVSQEHFFLELPGHLFVMAGTFLGKKLFGLIFSRTTALLGTSQMLASVSIRKAGLLNLFSASDKSLLKFFNKFSHLNRRSVCSLEQGEAEDPSVIYSHLFVFCVFPHMKYT